MKALAGSVLFALLAFGLIAFAQDSNFPTPGNARVPSSVMMCLNSSSQAVPCPADASGNLNVVGNVASGAADSGNPVKVGSVFNTSQPTVTNGQRVDFQADNRGTVLFGLMNANSGSRAVFLNTNSDGVAANAASNQLAVSVGAAYLFNGTTFDRQRNNIDTGALVTLTTAAAGTTNSADQTNYNGRGVQVGINITLNTTCSAVFSIQGKDAASGTYYTILSSSALASTGFTQLTAYPGTTASANAIVNQPLPRTWRIQAVLTGGSCSLTATVGASVIL